MPKSRLAMIPDLAHYVALANTRVAEIVLPFLNSEGITTSA
jgi:hypothetical protein